MAYIYHGVPETIKGTALIPLSKMETVDPDLQKKYLEKYNGRESVIERHIPLLDCAWDEVVQLLPLHPRQLFTYQQQIGIINEIPDYRYFEFDVNVLDSDSAVVYFKTAPGDDHVTVKWLADVNIDELQSIPQATINYYDSMVGKDEPVFNYQFIPHILYRGSIDISEAREIGIR